MSANFTNCATAEACEVDAPELALVPVGVWALEIILTPTKHRTKASRAQHGFIRSPGSWFRGTLGKNRQTALLVRRSYLIERETGIKTGKLQKEICTLLKSSHKINAKAALARS
jgi:hypothetical protein